MGEEFTKSVARLLQIKDFYNSRRWQPLFSLLMPHFSGILMQYTTSESGGVVHQKPAGESCRAPDAGPLHESARELVALVYHRLQRVAATLLRTEASDSFASTDLVHEAYIRLAESKNIEWHGKTHFFRVTVRQMRRILVDRGRKRRARKRVPEVLFCAPATELQQVDKLALEQALQELSSLSPRQAQVFKSRGLLGLTFPETARAMSISERTAKNDWIVARSWLAHHLHQSAVE